jgi:hypothetical protein
LLAKALIRSLPAQPHIWLSGLGAGLGYLVTRQWWTAPFVAAVATVPLLLAAHPLISQADRTLSPIWMSLNLGLSLLLAAGIAHIQARRESREPSSAA